MKTMKTNVAIETTDLQRVALANLVDSKVTKRKITRKEIQALCEQHIAGLLEQVQTGVMVKVMVPDPAAPKSHHELLEIDPEDEAILCDKPESYIIGWNKCKRRWGNS